MRILEKAELQAVAGGDSVESNLGAGAAIAIHGVASQCDLPLHAGAGCELV